MGQNISYGQALLDRAASAPAASEPTNAVWCNIRTTSLRRLCGAVCGVRQADVLQGNVEAGVHIRTAHGGRPVALPALGVASEVDEGDIRDLHQ